MGVLLSPNAWCVAQSWETGTTKNDLGYRADTSWEVDTTIYYVYIPRYSWSMAMGYTSLPSLVKNASFLPDNVELHWWLANRFYMQIGFFFQPDGVVPNNWFFQKGFAAYAGCTWKLFLRPGLYLIPSWNLYYDYYPADSLLQFSVTLGPTGAFEYFFHNRFSVTAHLLNVSYGVARQKPAEYKTRFTLHWALGISLRYHFDLRPLPDPSLVP